MKSTTVTQISSLHNPRVKHVVRLNNRRYRDAQRLTLVEGVREASRALDAGIIPREAYICTDLITDDAADGVIQKLQQLNSAGTTELIKVTPPLFAKIAYRGKSGGILLVIDYQEYSPDNLLQTSLPFIVVLDGAEKPGNIGAILRTADAAGVSGLILSTGSDRGTDIYNPNVIRASLGTIFTVPMISMPARETMVWLKNAGIRTVATTPMANRFYTETSLKGPIAVIMGSEAFGLSEEWLEAADLQVRIPMFGVVDSLNLSVATAVVLYEVVRQRILNDETD